MMMNKKSQGAVEFLMILIFVLILISVIMYTVGIKTNEFQKKTNKKEFENFAQKIFNKIKILEKVKQEYYKTIKIPTNYMKSLNKTIN